ncbi:metalloregulator ArsR/SmtB family transcription factor [Myxococcota bacterium]|jgi:DNA-binding transcriptional ArsR family regulator|nr:metalloregulator ArsR/SmtB family transcription factor [Myxococcota bacterium]
MLEQSTPPQDPLDRVFAALSDPARRGMVERLSVGPASATELAADYTMTLSAVVQHLKVLELSGLVTSHKTGRVRTFSVEPEALGPAQRWIDDRKRAWHRDLDRLEDLLRQQSP